MRKVTSVLAFLLIAILVCGTVAYAEDLRTYRQKGYDVEIEYYANTADMFMYLLYDKDYNLIAVGLDNEGCFVYGEWDHETGGVKQALNEYGEEYVVGVHPAPASSKLYPIPDIAYVAREKRVAEFEAANQHEEFVEPVDAITYGEYMELKEQAEKDGATFSPSYIIENKDKMKTQATFSAFAEAPRDNWSEVYPLHPVLPITRDQWTGTNFKTQPTVLVYITFDGDVDSMDRPLIYTDETKTQELMPLHPSYVNDMMFSDTEWRPYIDYRFIGPADNPLSADEFSYTYLANSKITDRNTIMMNVFGTLNPDPYNPVTNQLAFANGIYHGSVAHFINYMSKQRSAVEPALDFSGRGGVVTVVLPKSFAQPYDTGNVGQTIGKPNGAHNNSAANTRLRNETIKHFLAQMDVRQLPGAVFEPANNRWRLMVRTISIATMLTGYSYELSAERNVLNELVGVWGNSSSGSPSITVTAADLPAWYDGASVGIDGIYQMCSHALDESRALSGNNPANISVPRLTGIWPTRPRQFVVYAHEFSHNSLGAHTEVSGKTGGNIHSDTYDTSAQTRNQSAAELWPIFLSGDQLSTADRIVIASRDSTLTDIDAARDDTRNWFPGTRYAAAAGNWQTQGVGGYIGADDEDVAARGGAHDGWNMIERNRILAPRTLNSSQNNVRLEYGDIIRVLVAPPFNNTNFFDTYGGTTTAINNQAFYLGVRENSGYDKGVFDWARTHLTALGADPVFEGNKSGDARFSVRKLIVRGEPLPAHLSGYQTTGMYQNDTAFRNARGGLYISHLDVLYSQSSGTGNNASATYGFPFVTVEAHAYPSGIYTSGDAYSVNYGAGSYPFFGKYPDINRVALDPAYTAALTTNQGRIRTSFPETQHLLERYMVDRARGEYVSNDVRFNMGDPADLFNQWGVDEFVNPRLYSGDSRATFTGGTSGIMARSADVVRAMDRQRHPTGPVAPFAIRNVRFYDSSMPGYVPSPDNNGRSYVMFDFEITVIPTITLNSTDSEIPIGTTRTLVATLTPPEYTGDKTIAWTSSNPAVATVSNTGVVTPVSAGFTIIKAALSADATVFAECNVQVPIQATGVTLNPSANFSLNIGQTMNITATVTPAAVTNKRVTWSSNNAAVASVVASGDTIGIVTANASGTAVITATAVYGTTAATRTITVTVNTPVTGVTITPAAVTLLVGGTQALTANVLPATATNSNVTWTSSVPGVATVSATGVVTALALGSTTITVTTADGGFTANRNVAVLTQVGGVSITPPERTKIHAAVENLSGDKGNVYDLNQVDPNSLIGALLYGATYDTISRGGGGITPTEYPFPVTSNASNQNEGTRKTAKFDWVEQLSQNLGFPVIVRRQTDKLVYVEIGDPDAPEMIMALSHLDSPTSATNSSPQPAYASSKLELWRGPDLLIGPASAYYPNAYKHPYVHDGWLYGAGVQDDSGPTLATLLAAKALMDAGLPLDRRIRILMGAYEDGGPGTPSVANTANYMDIPYYTANPGFYDNWAYKYLNREETPIAGYTSDSRFPVIIGNSGSVTPAISMDLSSDTTEEYRLLSATASITARSGDVTLKDIAYGSTTQIASNAVFTLAVSAAAQPAFIANLNAAAASQGWTTTNSATAIANVNVVGSGNSVVITINTDVAMEMPTPQYGRNAIVWGMYLLSEAIGNAGVTSADLQLKKAADGIAAVFYSATGDKEREAYIGSNIIPNNLLRNPDNGTPNLTLALMGGLNTEAPVSFYTAGTGVLSIPLYLRYMYTSAADFTAGMTALTTAFTSRGFGVGATGTFSQPTLYMTHNNPLVALHLASYKATMQHDPAAFDDVYQFIDISHAQGTTGGTLASDFRNKMNAFGAIIPGNERWWHTANERISTKSIVQMTKLMADGMLEMARYTGPAGAKMMWADIPGLDADRADLDLLDVTVGTYKNASSAITPTHLSGATLLAATSFDIPMLRLRGNNGLTFSATTIAAGHDAAGIYLPANTIPANTTHVLPMRLEFKVKQPAGVTNAQWDSILLGDINDIASLFTFRVLNGSTVVPLTLPAGEKPDMFFYKRVSQYDPDTLYISVNLAITDGAYTGPATVVADSKTDLYKLNPNFLASNSNPFPDRGKIEQRGFFVMGDGAKNARFTSPTAIFVALEDIGVSLNETIVTLNVGDAVNLTATVVPNTAPNKNVTWSSSNTAVATVLGTGPYASTGIVRAISAGTATITVTTVDGGKTATCLVTVVQPATGVTVSPNVVSIVVGGNQQLTATVAPANATNQSVTWSSNDPTVATVSATGLITAIGVGTAVITVETVDGNFTDTCAVTVTPVPPVPVTGVTVSPTSDTLAIGATLQLTPTVAPANATNKNVTWSSNSPTVATVSSAGLVTAVNVGTAIITVSTVDGGFTDTCVITVTVAPGTLPVITTATLPNGTVNAAYNQTLAATGATPITWDVTVGALPDGLTLSTAGAIAGTPTAAGTFNFTVRATNSAGNDTNALSIVIDPAPGVAPTITTATLPNGTVNAAYNQTLVATGDTPITWDVTVGALPTGLTLSNAGVITGTPTVAGASSFTVRATNATGSDTSALTIDVDSVTQVPVADITLSLSVTTVEAGKTVQLVVTVTPPNATNPNVTWSTSNSSVATVVNGIVTGVAAGQATITVTSVEDSTFTDTCTITVTPAVVDTNLTYPSDLNGVANDTGIAASDLEAKDGKVYLRRALAEAIAKTLLGVDDVDTSIHPVFTATVTPDGSIAKVSLTVSGKDLLALTPDEIMLIGMVSGSNGELFGYVDSESQFGANKFTLLLGGAIYTGLIDPNEVYTLVAFIEDGGKFDLDGAANGKVISSVFFASEKSRKGGGSGCSTFGYLAFALLAVPFVVRKRQ